MGKLLEHPISEQLEDFGSLTSLQVRDRFAQISSRDPVSAHRLD